MKLLTCPAEFGTFRSFFSKVTKKVFLAGGISGCPDWQKEMIQRFANNGDGLLLMNPRRDNFDITDPNMSAFQIEWEDRYLKKADAILFWFPFETLCPITLFELGKVAAQGRKIFVACHPAYARKFDVEHQLKLLRPDITVHDNFQDMVDDINKWLDASVSWWTILRMMWSKIFVSCSKTYS